MKVLVIGSDGQLGLEFQKISNSYDSLSWFFSTTKTLDLLKLDSISSFLNNINPSVIINCAAYTNVDRAEPESELADIINSKAVKVISRWTSDNNKMLIHISTDYVFDGLSKLPYSENSLLYKNRNTDEAEFFLKNLLNHLKASKVDKFLDIACGKGRHAIFINKMGFDIEGIDLSNESIEHANEFANDKLKFKVHDMRSFYKKDEFDIILNLFTSFGYFDNICI